MYTYVNNRKAKRKTVAGQQTNDKNCESKIVG